MFLVASRRSHEEERGHAGCNDVVRRMDDQDDTTIDDATTATSKSASPKTVEGDEPTVGVIAVAPEGSEGIVLEAVEEEAVIEVELDLADLDEVPILDEADPAVRERRFRWTPGLGVSTKSAIRVGVMLGGKRGGTDGDKS